MSRRIVLAPLAASLLLGTSLSAQADPFFNRVATMSVRDNLANGGKGVKEAVAEIISAGQAGRDRGPHRCHETKAARNRRRWR
jgi:hypothetical protein